MAQSFTIRAGDIEPRVFTILYGVEGSEAARDLTGVQVNLYRVDSAGVTVVYNTAANPSLLAITHASAGEVTLTPTSTFWAGGVSWYNVHFTVTDGNGEHLQISKYTTQFNIQPAL